MLQSDPSARASLTLQNQTSSSQPTNAQATGIPSMINVHTRENLDTEDQINEIQDTKIENDD